jgi:hypothetical protein
LHKFAATAHKMWNTNKYAIKFNNNRYQKRKNVSTIHNWMKQKNTRRGNVLEWGEVCQCNRVFKTSTICSPYEKNHIQFLSEISVHCQVQVQN